MNNFTTEIENRINTVISNLQNTDLRPLLPTIASIIATKIDDNFRYQGRWNGSNSGIDVLSGGSNVWAARSKKTINSYSKSKRGITPKLKRSGVMKRQIEVKPSGKTGINISVNTPYAAIHQFGGVINIPAHERTSKWKATLNKKSGNYNFRFARKNSKTANTIERRYMTKARKIIIPARPYITLTPEDLDEIFGLIINYLS